MLEKSALQRAVKEIMKLRAAGKDTSELVRKLLAHDAKPMGQIMAHGVDPTRKQLVRHMLEQKTAIRPPEVYSRGMMEGLVKDLEDVSARTGVEHNLYKGNLTFNPNSEYTTTLYKNRGEIVPNRGEIRVPNLFSSPVPDHVMEGILPKPSTTLRRKSPLSNKDRILIDHGISSRHEGHEFREGVMYPSENQALILDHSGRGGQHNTLSVLGRESNDMRKLPYTSEGILSYRMRHGEAALIQAATGKRFGIDHLNAKDLQKLRDIKPTHKFTNLVMGPVNGFHIGADSPLKDLPEIRKAHLKQIGEDPSFGPVKSIPLFHPETSAKPNFGSKPGKNKFEQPKYGPTPEQHGFEQPQPSPAGLSTAAKVGLVAAGGLGAGTLGYLAYKKYKNQNQSGS